VHPCSWLPILLAWLVGGWAAAAKPLPEPFTARCVGVHDGESLTALRPGNVQVKVRLRGIDAPERGQPFSDAAKRALSALAFGKRVQVRPTGKDRYGRTLADVFAAEEWVNLRLVEGGHAWRFDRHSQSAPLGAAQGRARKARRGLWSAKGPVAPWAWRKAKSTAQVGQRADS
jgi:endonuclease YncB( thermonuclease family)